MKWKAISTLSLAVLAASCAPDQELPTGPGGVPSFSSLSQASSVLLTVKPSSLGLTWYDVSVAGAASRTFSTDVDAPLGSGVLQFSTTGTADRWNVFNNDWGNPAGNPFLVSPYLPSPATNPAGIPNPLPLSRIASLEFSTKTPSATVAPVLKIEVDPTGSGNLTAPNYTTLNFEPYWLDGNGNNLPVVPNVWQTWTLDPTSTHVWYTGSDGFTCIGPNADALPGGKQGCPMTFAQFLTRYPAADVVRAIGFGVGSGWSGAVANMSVDKLSLGIDTDGITGADVVVTYDFEPETQCTTTCYVDAATGNDAFGGDTPATAKKTIQAAVTQVTAGGTVIVAAGTYPEQVTISKDGLTLSGAGIGTSVLQGSSCTGTGIAITGNRTGITLRDLTVTGYQYGITTGNIGNTVSNITLEDLSASDNCVHGIWFQAGSSTNIAFTRIQASRNNAAGGLFGRGLWMINGTKENISITDGAYNDNGLVGIDLSDGNVTGAVISGNTVSGNRDAGIGVLGAGGTLATLIANNSVTNNGRYGIEIKMPGGTGAPSGPGSVVVTGNTVTRTIDATDARDYGGIVVIQRLSGNASVDALLPSGQPKGVFITLNHVSGFHRKPSGSTGDGFGIVVEGTNHTVTKNVVVNNDVGIQIQDGNPSLNAQSTPYFDRGNAAPSSALIIRNSITSNTDFSIRNVGAPLTDATCNWYGAASGPQAGKLSGALTTDPWLTSANLEAVCPVPPDTEAPVVTNVAVSPNPAPYTTETYELAATATDNVGVTAASYTINGGDPVAFSGFTPGTSVSLSATLGPLPVGVHDICVTAKDAADNTSNTECTMLAVYDPDAGFVTGGGWINSPAGAYVPDETLTGKATFGFVSKYVKGKALPTGNTQFQFKAGDLNFSSTSYEWLVVSGARAQFKGAGTINGSGDYRFMLTVIDGQINGGGGTDKFRIRIWNNDGGGLVYDNQLNDPDSAAPTTVIGGGSIVIHVPKK